MTLIEDKNHIDDLIGKVLAGEATADEQDELMQWLNSEPANQKYFDQVKEIFTKAEAREINVQFDTDAAWQKVKSGLQKKEQPKQVWFDPRALLRSAAGIVLVLAAGYVALQLMKPDIETVAITAKDVTIQDTLPDGSMAFLNRQSSITYQYNSDQKVRTVKLRGEGFFEVKHEEQKPFVIETDEVLIRDIGTAFNVKAYPDQDTIEVFVESGIVQLFTAKDPGIQLNAGETGLYSKRGKVFAKAPAVDTNVLAYKTKMLSFNATELQSAISTINAVYDSKIRLGNNELGTCRLTVNFINEDLNHLVDIIAETLTLTIERKDGEIILNGKCQ